MSASMLKKFILSELRNRGVSAKKEGVATLVEIAKGAERVQETLEELLDAVSKEELPNGVVDSDIIHKVMQTMEGEDSGDPGSNTVIISAFDAPEFKYNVAKRVFQEVNGERQRFADADSKGSLFRERYFLIEQRLLRHQSFTKPFAITAAAASEYYQLTRIEALQGSGREAKIVLGMIGQPDLGKFTLEDLSGTVPIDVSKVTSNTIFRIPTVLSTCRRLRQLWDSSQKIRLSWRLARWRMESSGSICLDYHHLKQESQHTRPSESSISSEKQAKHSMSHDCR
jgi:hypothetical protein